MHWLLFDMEDMKTCHVWCAFDIGMCSLMNEHFEITLADGLELYNEHDEICSVDNMLI